MFQLTKEELELWRSQIVISKPAARMAQRRRPYAFSEQGVAMLSSVLRSSQAVKVNLAIMRAFVRLRELLATHKDLAQKLSASWWRKLLRRNNVSASSPTTSSPALNLYLS